MCQALRLDFLLLIEISEREIYLSLVCSLFDFKKLLILISEHPYELFSFDCTYFSVDIIYIGMARLHPDIIGVMGLVLWEIQTLCSK